MFNWNEIIAKLGVYFALVLAQTSRVPDDYYLQALLPEINMPDYSVDAGSMTIRPTMAGMSPMDSPYAKTGAVTSYEFSETTTKITHTMDLSEKQQRDLNQIASSIASRGLVDGVSPADIRASLDGRGMDALLKFTRAGLQAHWDTMEWLRAKALSDLAVDWNYNGVHLQVDYGATAGHLISRTIASAKAYHLSGSSFWEDYRTAKKLLRNRVRVILMNSDTYDTILTNPAHNIEVQMDDGITARWVRLVGTTERRSTDMRDSITVVRYDLGGTVITPAGKGKTTLTDVNFIATGDIIFIGDAPRSEYILGDGSNPDAEIDTSLGYTHIAPTIEGGGRLGRFLRTYVPQDRLYQVINEGVTNGLPVITNPDRVVRLRTQMP